MALAQHLIIRAHPDDIAAVATIADAMRATGRPFVTRTEAVRHALAATAAAMVQQKGTAQ